MNLTGWPFEPLGTAGETPAEIVNGGGGSPG
jgi:hypothetical protein